ncbi:PQQ-binding-like beta-propeller repeat protein [Planctomycetota bacterium]
MGAVVFSTCRKKNLLAHYKDSNMFSITPNSTNYYVNGLGKWKEEEEEKTLVFISSSESHIYALDAIDGEEIWKSKPDGGVSSHMLIRNGNLYVGSRNGSLYALDAKYGNELRRYQVGSDTSLSRICTPPVFYDSKIYVINYDGLLQAFDERFRSIYWTYKTDWQKQGGDSIVSVDNYIIGTDYNYLYSLDGKTGQKCWRNSFPGPIKGITAIDGIIFLYSVGDYYCVDARTGKINWITKDKISFKCSPAIANGMAYISTRLPGKCLYAIDIRNGKVLWSSLKIKNGINATRPTVTDKIVYFSSLGIIYALNAKTGELIWEIEMKDIVTGTAAAAKGKLYVCTRERCLYALDAGNGKELWKFQTEDVVYCSPIVAD